MLMMLVVMVMIAGVHVLHGRRGRRRGRACAGRVEVGQVNERRVMMIARIKRTQIRRFRSVLV